MGTLNLRIKWGVIMEAFIHGVSTRSVDDLVSALGIASGVSKSTVSSAVALFDHGSLHGGR